MGGICIQNNLFCQLDQNIFFPSNWESEYFLEKRIPRFPPTPLKLNGSSLILYSNMADINQPQPLNYRLLAWDRHIKNLGETCY